jgi:hypothetical protein
VPAQALQLATPHAGGRRQPERREQPVTSRRTQERLELFSAPGAVLDPRDRAPIGRVGDQRDIAGNQAAPDGVAERAPDDQVNLVDGLGCQPRPGLGRVEHLAVEGFEVMGPQSTQPDPPEGGEDVELGLADITPVGAGSDRELLARQPLGHQVRTERQGADLIVPAVTLGGQPSREPLGLVSVGAGGVPAALCPTGDGVEAFVDDGVVAVALASDVALHGVLLSQVLEPCDPGRTTGRTQLRWRPPRGRRAECAGQHATPAKSDPVEPLSTRTALPGAWRWDDLKRSVPQATAHALRGSASTSPSWETTTERGR